MKVIHGVVTLEQAKRLHELGYVLSYDESDPVDDCDSQCGINHDILHAPESPF